jgi:O-antigen/teichoic acid export membrane protein
MAAALIRLTMPTGDLVRRIFRGGAWSLFGKLSGAILFVALNALLAHLLPTKDVGAFFICFSIVSAASLLIPLGANQAIVRYMAAARAKGQSALLRPLLGRSMMLWGVGAVIVMTALGSGLGRWILEGLFDAPELDVLLPLLMLWGALAASQFIVAEAFRGLEDIRAAAVVGGGQTGGVATALLTVLFIILAWSTGSVDVTLQTVILTATIACGVVTVTAFALLFRRLPPAAVARAGNSAGLWVPSTMLPYLVVTFSQYVFQQADLWVVGAVTGQEELAAYGTATRLVFAVALPLMALNGVLPPLISELFAAGRKEQLEKILRSTATLATGLTFLVLTVLALTGIPLITYLFGSDYVAGLLPMLVLGIGRLVNAVAGSCTLVLLMTGHQGRVMRINVSCAAGTLLLAVPAGSLVGSLGVAIAFCTGLAIQNLITVRAATSLLGVRTYVGPISINDIKRVIGSRPASGRRT